MGRLEEAQQSVEAALKAQPDLVEARELRGGLLARKKQFAEAAGEYRQALKLRPDLSRLHLALANMLAAQGDRAGVVQHLREAARAKDPQVAQEATRLLKQLGQR